MPEEKRPAWTLPCNVSKDLTHLQQAHPHLGPAPSPASGNCLGKLTQWSFQPLCGGRAVLERLLVTFHSQNLVVLHCTLATANLHHDLGLPTNSKYAPCLVLCNICYYCKKHLNYKGPGRSTENKGWSLISSNMVIQGVLAGVNQSFYLKGNLPKLGKMELMNLTCYTEFSHILIFLNTLKWTPPLPGTLKNLHDHYAAYILSPHRPRSFKVNTFL